MSPPDFSGWLRPDSLGGELKRRLSGHKRSASGALATMGVGITGQAFAGFGQTEVESGSPVSPVSPTTGEAIDSRDHIGRIFQKLDGGTSTDLYMKANYETAAVSRLAPDHQHRESDSDEDGIVVDIGIYCTSNRRVRRSALADTGADDNFIAYRVVKDAGLEKDILELPPGEGRSYYGAGEQPILPRGRLRLEWTGWGHARTWAQEFYVIDINNCDVILGRKFLISSGYIKVNRHALMVLHKKSNTEKEARKQEKMRKQDEENKKLEEEEEQKKKLAASSSGSGKKRG